MNNPEITIFENEKFGKVRVVLKDNKPWLVALDVATALGYTNPTKAIKDHIQKDDLTNRYPIRDSLGREQNVTIINESGFYSLVLGSKLPTAQQFKHWVTSKVLPSIRKTGSYSGSNEVLDCITAVTKVFISYHDDEGNLQVEEQGNHISTPMKAVNPTTCYINNTKLMNQLNNPKIELDENDQIHFKLNTGGKKTKKPIMSVIDIDFSSNIVTTKKITEYDKIVQNAIYTVIKSGSNVFTPQMIARVMAGDMKKKITPKKLKLVTESIKKLQRTFITIDMTKETIARNQDVKEAKIDGYMLPVTSVYVKMASNGKEISAYKLLDKPLLYKYAERLKQIITVPFELLNIKGTSDTEDVTVLKNYLLRRIELMKNEHNNVESYNISYKKIYELLNVSEQNSVSNNVWKLKTSDIRKTVKEILDYWAEIGYIAKYSEYIDSGNYKNMGGIIIDIC